MLCCAGMCVCGQMPALLCIFVLNSPVKTLCAVTALSSHTINLTHIKKTVLTSVRSMRSPDEWLLNFWTWQNECDFVDLIVLQPSPTAKGFCNLHWLCNHERKTELNKHFTSGFSPSSVCYVVQLIIVLNVVINACPVLSLISQE